MSKKNKWVVYPDIDLTIDDLKKHWEMEEKDITEIPVNEELNNFEETSVEEKELTEEEKREIYVKQLKESKIRFKPVKHYGNITVNQFGKAYHKSRQAKNKQAKASRRQNRKK